MILYIGFPWNIEVFPEAWMILYRGFPFHEKYYIEGIPETWTPLYSVFFECKNSIAPSLPWFVSSDDHLKYSHACASLPIPKLWIRVQSLEDVESFRCVIELTHLWKERGRDDIKHFMICEYATKEIRSFHKRCDRNTLTRISIVVGFNPTSHGGGAQSARHLFFYRNKLSVTHC